MCSGIGYATAFPTKECSIFIAGTLGIFAFNEIRGRAVLVFYISAVLLIGGAAMLSLASTNP